MKYCKGKASNKTINCKIVTRSILHLQLNEQINTCTRRRNYLTIKTIIKLANSLKL